MDAKVEGEAEDRNVSPTSITSSSLRALCVPICNPIPHPLSQVRHQILHIAGTVGQLHQIPQFGLLLGVQTQDLGPGVDPVPTRAGGFIAQFEIADTGGTHAHLTAELVMGQPIPLQDPIQEP
jgi:hypothetical protein